LGIEKGSAEAHAATMMPGVMVPEIEMDFTYCPRTLDG
jgi:hypothetical protein